MTTMTDNGKERRRFTRVPFEAEVSIIGKQDHWTARLFDISLKGVLVERPADWNGAPGERYRLELRLDEPSAVLIRMPVVTVAHSNPARLGLRCEQIELDSLAYLKQLMALNVGDGDLIDRELSQLGK